MEDTHGMNNKIRVGILLDSYDIPNWSYIMLQEILESSYAEIVLIVKNDSKVKRKKFSQGLLNKRKKLIYRTYRRVDRKLFKCNPDAFERKNIRNLLSVPSIEVNPRETKYCDWIDHDDLLKIRTFDVDIFIRMGFRILKGGILKAAKYGVWSYHHGDNKINRGGPAGFWEVMKNQKETGVVLQILNENLDNGTILYKSYSLTDKISVNRNVNRCYWKGLSFLPAKIKELYILGGKAFFNKVALSNHNLEFYDKPLYKDPSNLEMLKLLIEKFIQISKQRLSDLFYFDQWILMYKYNKLPEISTSFFQFKKIISPKDRIWADPFLVYKNGKYYIFIEEMLFRTNKGVISVIEIDAKGNYSKPLTVLEADCHLSYPYIFEDKGSLYMIPETKGNRSIELYKCEKFPSKWKFEKALMKNLTAVDSSVLFHDGKYWLFTNIVRNKGASSHDELFLFYADDLENGTWVAHPENPIVSDVKKARMAGKPFLQNNQLYRPSQNCSHHYGYGLKINKIEVLTTEKYKEITVDSIQPDWDTTIIGTHTLNNCNNMTIIDALQRRRRFF